ncbi:MAG: YhdH/YhfP family quinone oxidoreductase [Tissierellia bacterium]|nr:YhdH/YhfP family quinone oxidoreductase [Tissierellia bacterium]
MDNVKFKALQISEIENNIFKREIVKRSIEDLPEGEVLIKVEYSSLNYKDALSSIGNKGVTRNYPHTPGIDAAGIVVNSTVDQFNKDDMVIVTGYDFGMNTSGGFAEYIRVPSKWVLKLPENLSLKESMIYGTGGFTAALSVYKLIQSGIKKEDGDILVTGATGGVGSVAVSILSKLGYNIIASTGKMSEKDMLIKLGAKDIINRKELHDTSGKAMLKGKWAGVIDTVGGNTLATAIKSTNYGGSITCCGNVGGADFSSSVYPFILRGITLYGVDSVACPMSLRQELWEKLSNEWKIHSLNDNIDEVTLEELMVRIDSMLKGQHTGRTIVKL